MTATGLVVAVVAGSSGGQGQRSKGQVEFKSQVEVKGQLEVKGQVEVRGEPQPRGDQCN